MNKPKLLKKTNKPIGRDCVGGKNFKGEGKKKLGK